MRNWHFESIPQSKSFRIVNQIDKTSHSGSVIALVRELVVELLLLCKMDLFVIAVL